MKQNYRNDDFHTMYIGEIIKAANKMLEEKGIAPIEPSPMLRRALKLQSENGEKPQSETENKQ